MARSLVLAVGLVAAGVGCTATPAELDAAALDLPAVERPSAATQGAAKGFLGPFAGGVALTAANDAALEAAAGLPLLADDRLRVDAGGLAVVLFTNGKVLRIEGPFDQAVRDLAGFGDPPGGADLEAQLRGALSPADRERLVASSERIGGWQLRLKALDSVAPEDADAAMPARAPETEDAKDAKGKEEEPASDGLSAELVGTAPGGEPPRNESSLGGQDTPSLDTGDSYGSGERDPNASNAGLTASSSSTTTTKKKAKKKDDKASKTNDAPQPQAKDDVARRPLEGGGGLESDAPTWRLVSARWVASGDAITLAKDLKGSILACLKALSRDSATVDITVAAGKITKLEVQGVSSLKCVEEFSGRALPGVSASGVIRASLKRQ
ncbi:MAG: hypothetical protein R3A79_03850 [Nannocystaceae bacterium]